MPIDLVALALGSIMLAGAGAALSLRNLIHCALCLMVSFLGLAGLYLRLGALFPGLVQVLVYVGAVGILLVFAILLTEGGGREGANHRSPKWKHGAWIAALLGAALVGGVLKSPSLSGQPRHSMDPKVRSIGERLMSDCIIPLQIAGLLLTATAIGGIVLAMPDPKSREERK